MWHHGVRQRLANHLRGGTAEAAGVGVGTNLTSSVQRLSACGVSGSEPRQSSASGATPFGPISTAPSLSRHIWRTSELEDPYIEVILER